MSDTNEKRIVNETTGGEKGQKVARFDLLPYGALAKVAERYGVGAEKYADHNWRQGYEWSLSIGALGRHFAAFVEGEDYDPETEGHHLTAVVFHALALLTFADEHPELDDRFKAAEPEPEKRWKIEVQRNGKWGPSLMRPRTYTTEHADAYIAALARRGMRGAKVPA